MSRYRRQSPWSAQPVSRRALLAISVVGALVLSLAPAMPRASAAPLTARQSGTVRTTTTTAPSSTSAASLYISNWSDLTAIWNASQLNQNDTGSFGPRIAELRAGNQPSINQIVDYSGFFTDTTDTVKYDQIHNFTSSAYLDENGVLNTAYGDYGGTALPISIHRDYVMVPNEPFLVVRYTLTNPSSTTSYTWSLLDQAHLNNTASGTDVQASYDTSRNAMFGDMTASGQDVVTLGAFQSPTDYQVGNDSDCTASDATASAWCQYDGTGTLHNNATLSTPNVDLGFQNNVTIGPGSTQTLYYYLGVGNSLAAAQSAADTARAHPGAFWFTTTASDYADWLASGADVSTTDSGVNIAYLRNLVVMKNAQNPNNGLWPAATNEGSYGYKAWMRDSSFDAMALDAAGHHSEAAQFWQWMANHQLPDGTWHTTYDEWSGDVVSFVEPEYDSLGEFLVGVEKHYAETGDTTFLTAMWPAVQSAADFIQDNIASNGLGAADASIWEEAVQYNVFTQALYVAGLRAAALLAQDESDGATADAWNGAASTILSAVQRSDTWDPAGLYNSAGYYDRGVNTDGSVNSLLDSSSMALVVFGDIDANSSRAAALNNTIVANLTHDTSGIARYTDDGYYFDSPFDPAGNEALAAEPVWPNVTMFDAIYDVFSGDSAEALTRLQWYAGVSGVGYMPPGEAVAWPTGQPVLSTMSEPLTAASFVLAALTYTGAADTKVAAGNANAGAFDTISVTTTPGSDWPQWQDVPYFTDPIGDNQSGTSMTDVGTIAMSNDANNIYLRVDNASGSLSGFGATPKFALLVYGQDFNHDASIPTLSTGEFGAPLDHPMNFLVGRWSDSDTFSTFTPGADGWTFASNLTSIAPQWDTTTGRLEAAIPISALASGGSAPVGSFAYLEVELAYQNPTTGAWIDDDIVPIHYRITGSGQAWLYGNVSR